MWQPANKAAFPSPGDFEHAKNAINELEDVLTDALVVLERAQSRVLALTKELYERKAWIAPVRKLPSEILSEIFIFGSEMEHLAPVTITEVSRLWRAVVLATPRAWSLIHANVPEHEHHPHQYVSTFVERSKPCLLHIWIQDRDDSAPRPPEGRVLPLLQASLSRIRCLSIGSRQLRTLSEECMPNLAKLTITDWDRNLGNDISPFFISRDRFPRLQSIQSIGCPWGDSMSLAPFPPLQELAIQINNRSTWLDVVTSCSASLKSLSIGGNFTWTERTTIIFPRLQSLGLYNWSGSLESEGRSISMVTPVLISYDECSSSTTSSRLRHSDVKSVIYLKSNHLPDLAPCTSLRVLQLPLEYNSGSLGFAGALAEQLKRGINTSPALERVEFGLSLSNEEGLELEATKRHVIEKITSARPGIEVSFKQRLSPIPGSIEENLCKSCMPCSYGLA